MTRKINTSQFFSRDQEEANKNANRIGFEEGSFIVEMPYLVGCSIHNHEMNMYEYKWRWATQKEKQAMMEKRREEGIKNGIVYPFNII